MPKKTFSLVIALFVLISATFITNCSKQEDSLQDEFTEQEKITTLNIPVTVKEGALLFKDHHDFSRTLRILDTVDLASRKAWEKSLGFTSIRSIYESVLDKHYNGESINYSKYNAIIDFSGSIPTLKNNDDFTASVLNQDNIVYMADYICTVQVDGWYWIKDSFFLSTRFKF